MLQFYSQNIEVFEDPDAASCISAGNGVRIDYGVGLYPPVHDSIADWLESKNPPWDAVWTPEMGVRP